MKREKEQVKIVKKRKWKERKRRCGVLYLEKLWGKEKHQRKKQK